MVSLTSVHDRELHNKPTLWIHNTFELSRDSVAAAEINNGWMRIEMP